MEKHGSASFKQPQPSAVAELTKPVHILYLLDETGSMGIVRNGAIEAFNDYLKGVKKAPNSDSTKFTFITFNSSTGPNERYGLLPLNNAVNLTYANYSPHSATPLYDAISHGIARADEIPDHDVIMVIHTDGQENSSLYSTREDILRLIENRREKGWVFVFLGADQDAWTHASNIGIPSANTYSYDNTDSDTKRAVGEVSVNTMAYMNASPSARRETARNFTGTGKPVDLRKEENKIPRWKKPIA